MEQALAGVGFITLFVFAVLVACSFKPIDSEYKELDKKFPRKQ